MHIEMANIEIEVKIVRMHISFGIQITMENAPECHWPFTQCECECECESSSK